MTKTTQYLGIRQLHDKFGAGRSLRAFATWLARAEAAGRFPCRLHLSERVVAWRIEEVAEYERMLLEARQADKAA